MDEYLKKGYTTYDWFTNAKGIRNARKNIKNYLKRIGYKHIRYTGMYSKSKCDKHGNNYWLRFEIGINERG